MKEIQFQKIVLKITLNKSSISANLTPPPFYFLLYKKKVLISCKFLISGFWWICTFWDVLNTIWLFLENVCVWRKLCGKCKSVWTEFHENLTLVSSQHKLVSINIWWKSFKRWLCNQTFSTFFGMRRSWLLLNEI